MKKLFTLVCAVLGICATTLAENVTNTSTVALSFGTSDMAVTDLTSVTVSFNSLWGEYFLTDKTNSEGTATIKVSEYSGCKIVYSGTETDLANLQVKVMYGTENDDPAQYKALDDYDKSSSENGNTDANTPKTYGDDQDTYVVTYDEDTGLYTMEFDFLTTLGEEGDGNLQLKETSSDDVLIYYFDLQCKTTDVTPSVNLYSVELIEANSSDNKGGYVATYSEDDEDDTNLLATGSPWWGCSAENNYTTTVTFSSEVQTITLDLGELSVIPTLSDGQSFEDEYEIIFASAGGAEENLTLSAVDVNSSSISSALISKGAPSAKLIISSTDEDVDITPEITAEEDVNNGNNQSVAVATLRLKAIDLSSIDHIELQCTSTSGVTITISDMTLTRTISSEVSYSWEGSIEIVADSNNSWWSTAEISMDALIGNLIPEDVTSIVFTCDDADTFVICYNSVNEIDSSNSNAYWFQSGDLTSYTATDINLDTEGYYLVLVVRENDNLPHTISWVAYGESIDPDWTAPALTAIAEVTSDVEVTEVARYNLMGQKISGAEKGINIIVYSDGSAKKVLVK